MPMPEHEAVTKARRGSDLIVLFGALAIIAAALLTMFLFGLLFIAVGSDIAYDEVTGEPSTFGDYFFSIGLYGIIFGVILLITLVTIRILRQQFLGNALQVEYSDYAWLRDWSNKVAADLQMPQVEIFVTQDPVINAFAVGFRTPYNIVLNSGSIRYLTKDELRVIVVHEMGHVKYHHTQWTAYLGILTALPVVGSIAGWLIGFWSRRAELTADRLALCYMKNPKLVKNALVKVHVGPDVAASFNETARKWQEHTTSNGFNQFAQTFSNHPFLVRRLQHIDANVGLVSKDSEV